LKITRNNSGGKRAESREWRVVGKEKIFSSKIQGFLEGLVQGARVGGGGGMKLFRGKWRGDTPLKRGRSHNPHPRPKGRGEESEIWGFAPRGKTPNFASFAPFPGGIAKQLVPVRDARRVKGDGGKVPRRGIGREATTVNCGDTNGGENEDFGWFLRGLGNRQRIRRKNEKRKTKLDFVCIIIYNMISLLNIILI
jgi:hypothetical protein